MLIDIDI